ncbi:AAA family ATPase [Methylomonas sp. MgM2]
MNFHLIPRGDTIPKTGVNTVYLQVDRWNDYSFVTMFYMSIHDAEGNYHEIGNVKIGFKGQTTEISTHTTLQDSFEALEENYFSLGQDIDYYRRIANLPVQIRVTVLTGLRDIVYNPDLISIAREEGVFSVSLLREVSLSVIKGQFARVLVGQPPLTNFEFKFVKPKEHNIAEVALNFKVKVNSTPSTNIHAIIGRNGVGKTTLLNSMIEAITSKGNASAKFFNIEGWQAQAISSDYFSSLVSVSFSAFDPFSPPQEQPDPAKGTCYFYVGLKDREVNGKHRTIPELREDCVRALVNCFSRSDKTSRWLRVIEKLGSDDNFSSMELSRLEDRYRQLRNTSNSEQIDSNEFRKRYYEDVETFLSRMSSGHAIVLLTISRLVATVEEKTLVLIDEPESHLHPPLLSAFVRALADLLHDRNGVAIIATHSPVVLQEIPKSCVWKINRIGLSVDCRRPEKETFGENVGVLTREVFGLEVVKSGFHDLLIASVDDGGSYDEIIDLYKDQLGFEARAILKALVTHRDRSLNNDATE